MKQHNGSNIDFIIAVRDRDNKRIQNSINSFKNYANKVFVVDYGSKNPVNVKNAEIIRYDGSKEWNKSHALNLAIKQSKSEYICTVDCDMILNELLLDDLVKNLGEYVVIFNTNVRRISTKDISKDYGDMLKKSKHWFDNNYSNIYSKANGGIQAFPRSFIEKVGGYDEGLGLYWGAMDNRIYEQAKGLGMTIIDLNIPMLHQEHSMKKEDNLNPEEREIAQFLRAYKIEYLKELINNWDFQSLRPWGGKKPNHQWIIDNMKKWKEKLIPISRVCVSITSNLESVPIYFMLDLISMMRHARIHGIETVIFSMKNAHGVDVIRNNAVAYAMKEKCTHLLQLDTDHRYPEETITKLISHKKLIVGGVTNKRVPDFNYTQYKDPDNYPVNSEDNIFDFDNPQGLVKIGATGMAGTLIRLDVFNSIEQPFFEFKRTKKEGKIVNTGEDITFCKKVKKAGIDIWCDTELSFPHQVSNVFVDRRRIVQR